MREPDQRFDIAVVGAGVVGSAAALGLARLGYSTALIDTARLEGPGGDTWDPRVYALSRASKDLLDSLGVWPALDESRIAPVYDMRIFPVPAAQAAPGDEIHLSAYESGQDCLAWMLEERNLLRGLATATRIAGVARIESAVRSLANAPAAPHARLCLADGTALDAALVVGADGAGSVTRGAAGIRAQVRDYPQTAIVANLRTGRPHRDCAWQWFGEHGILALLPLAGAARVGIVWSAPRPTAERILADPTGNSLLVDGVSRISGRVLGDLEVDGEVRGFPLRCSRVCATVSDRVALVGDAAHVVHPLAGQGLNLGLGDVRALMASLAGSGERPRAAEDPGERRRLRRYARARAEPVATMRLATDLLQRVFDVHGRIPGPLDAVRRVGWRAVAGSSLLRRQLVLRASA